MKGVLGILGVVVIIVVLASGSHGSGNSGSQPVNTAAPPKPAISKNRAEAAFHRAVEEVAKGGLIKVGRLGTVETDCEAAGTHWGCNGWFVAETGEYCVTVGANVNNAGHVGKETYGKLPLGEPGGSECKL